MEAFPARTKTKTKFEELPNLLTHKEAATFLRISPLTLTDWKTKKAAPPFYKVGGRCLYPRDELLTWLEQRDSKRLNAPKRVLPNLPSAH